ncbi:odorant receptor 9a-like [Linepithema humile]|uniref:odorant receptor 9a-like n=1 Tax=Linepithema humile TaxID=83485 RepID=UPI00351E3D0B
MTQYLYEARAIEERFYRINRVFLKSIALWPYQQSYFWRIQKILFATIMITFLLVQLLPFVTMQFNRDLFLKIMWGVFICTTPTIKYCFFAVKAGTVKQLLERMRNDWNLLKSKLEIDIIEKYASNAKLFTTIVTAVNITGLFFMMVFQFWPLILNVILPLNESRSCELLVVVEYFVNKEKYLYVMLLHEFLAIFIGMIAACSVSVTFIIYILHTCALLKIASHRVETVFDISMLTNPRREYLFSQKIADVVVVHRRAIESLDYLMSNIMILYSILIIVGVISLSFSLFQCLLLIKIANDITSISLNIITIVALLAYMFVGNYVGQEVTDHGVNFFRATCNGLWYTAPVRTQKLILFLMQKGIKNITLRIGNLYDASLEGFTALVNMAVSYFMLMYQTQ